MTRNWVYFYDKTIKFCCTILFFFKVEEFHIFWREMTRHWVCFGHSKKKAPTQDLCQSKIGISEKRRHLNKYFNRSFYSFQIFRHFNAVNFCLINIVYSAKRWLRTGVLINHRENKMVEHHQHANDLWRELGIRHRRTKCNILWIFGSIESFKLFSIQNEIYL